ncbi:MAG: hypothetical protein ACM3TT_06745 [Syntrophothermus sp.]
MNLQRRLRMVTALATMLATLLSMVLLPAFDTPALALGVVSPLTGLGDAEKAVYGQEQGGSLLQRVDRLEKDLFGRTQPGALIARIDNIQLFLSGNSGPGPSLTVKLNVLEWFVTQAITRGPLATRVKNIEILLYGAPQDGQNASLTDRVDKLVKLTWPGGNMDTAPVEVPQSTLVKIRLLTELNSTTSKLGDSVQYRVIQDVAVNGRTVVPAGTMGRGTVVGVGTSGQFGKDGRVQVDFGDIPALDGKGIALKVDEKATEMNRSLELAAGASMAGVLLLGPVGLIGAYFVKGKDMVIPVGTEFFVEVAKPVTVTGLKVGGK